MSSRAVPAASLETTTLRFVVAYGVSVFGGGCAVDCDSVTAVSLQQACDVVDNCLFFPCSALWLVLLSGVKNKVHAAGWAPSWS